jgi:hypothetical protein
LVKGELNDAIDALILLGGCLSGRCGRNWTIGLVRILVVLSVHGLRLRLAKT